MIMAFGCVKAAPTPRTPQAAVKLAVSQATVERLGDGLLFRCAAAVDNATGRELLVFSQYSSAFDGLDLIVTDKRAQKLAQQPYTYHQSLCFLEGRRFALRDGRTEKVLSFAVSGLSPEVAEYHILLVGRLPGSDYDGILCSNMTPAPWR
jgi:hypothetical protein